MSTTNCWEALNCGKQNECPAYPHHGRTCFAVANTLCRGERQGDFAEKIGECRSVCDFYVNMMGTAV